MLKRGASEGGQPGLDEPTYRARDERKADEPQHQSARPVLKRERRRNQRRCAMSERTADLRRGVAAGLSERRGVLSITVSPLSRTPRNALPVASVVACALLAACVSCACAKRCTRALASCSNGAINAAHAGVLSR